MGGQKGVLPDPRCVIFLVLSFPCLHCFRFGDWCNNARVDRELFKHISPYFPIQMTRAKKSTREALGDYLSRLNTVSNE